ncbi:NgoBV family restriction endonuclease [Flavobacterium nackdongense]|uniref:NgoBV family restriction endonuclease n=1 Tax=Flavobacterium nackdongense TaxID=2547394 RepID=A0A4P6YB22_9FLAO|nr:NgoBV family restriction endonuclease [Flavobacterium nackdongense]QBN19358.1 NgoBV family restriction endonuclease [Flavobacterium nackdongense]
MKLTAGQLYKKLVTDNNLIGQKGKITFNLMNITLEVETKDTVGNLVQEWIKAWMLKENIDFGDPPNTQDFPDFQLDLTDPKKGLLEVKCFDYDASPNFDIAAFLAYRRSLLEYPFRLDSDYLIVGYSMQGTDIIIKDVWLKKVWEICGPSEQWALRCNVKQGEPTNIRPIKWYDNSRTTFKPFNNAKEFVEAFDNTQRQWARTSRDAVTSTWLKKVISGYKKTTGKVLI